MAVGILFLLLWDSGGTILTPELKTTSPVVPWVQVAIAGSMLFRATARLGAVGILGLYVYAVAEYGAFHMMDYPVFPATAVYLALTGIKSTYLSSLQLPVLYAGIAATMMWGRSRSSAIPTGRSHCSPRIASLPSVSISTVSCALRASSSSAWDSSW